MIFSIFVNQLCLENPLNRLATKSRIAAKFPSQQELDDSERTSRATFSSALSHQSRSESGSSISNVGRGRGLLNGINEIIIFKNIILLVYNCLRLGWNSHAAEPVRGYRYSSDEYPNLHWSKKCKSQFLCSNAIQTQRWPFRFIITVTRANVFSWSVCAPNSEENQTRNCSWDLFLFHNYSYSGIFFLK